MKILLTGNKGFIGSHLEKKLIASGHNIKGFDIKNNPAEDIRNEKAVDKAFEDFKPDIVIHLAAMTGVRNSLLYPQQYFETNICGTYNLLNSSRKNGISNFIMTSSTSVYGKLGEKGDILKEDMNCDYQLSPYGVSKRATELVCKLFSDIPTIIIRPLAVYGENGRKDLVIYKLIEAGLQNHPFYKYGDGSSTRAYTHVDDFNDGILKVLNYKPDDNFEIFNFSGGTPITLNRLISIAKVEFPSLEIKEAPIDPADVSHAVSDFSKAKKKLGYNPYRDFETEVKKLCQIYKHLGNH
ncbi:MAG: NAD-dependent epimerase/dehydratase family protein [Candidatus Paceibacterota bacterium]|jgi:UDP-glucuronate 4-epimerase